MKFYRSRSIKLSNLVILSITIDKDRETCIRRKLLIVIMAFAGDYENSIVLDEINDAMSIGYSTTPAVAQVAFQALGFSDAFKRGAFDILYDIVDPFEYLLILSLPIEVILPSTVFPHYAHDQSSMSSCSEKCALPLWTSFIIDSICSILFLE